MPLVPTSVTPVHFELALGFDGGCVLAADEEGELAIGSAVQGNAQAVRDDVAVDRLRGIVREGPGIDDHAGSVAVPVALQEHGGSGRVPHHLVGHADDVPALDADAADRAADLRVDVHRGDAAAVGGHGVAAHKGGEKDEDGRETPGARCHCCTPVLHAVTVFNGASHI